MIFKLSPIHGLGDLSDSLNSLNLNSIYNIPFKDSRSPCLSMIASNDAQSFLCSRVRGLCIVLVLVLGTHLAQGQILKLVSVNITSAETSTFAPYF